MFVHLFLKIYLLFKVLYKKNSCDILKWVNFNINELQNHFYSA